MSTNLRFLIACGMLWTAAQASAQAFLDSLDEKMSFQCAALGLRGDVSFMPDATLFFAEQAAQGLLVSDDEVFFAPRFLAFLDMQVGDRLTLHAQMRADRGFDPGAAPEGEVRLDEYYAQVRLGPRDAVNLRAGKFATAFGRWAQRSLSWDNPFVTAPMAYEDVLPVSDINAPASRAGFAARRNLPDNKPAWLPVLWGPSYATGASVFGGVDALEYAVEVKNAGIASRPTVWDAVQYGFPTNPTFTGRLGLKPAPEWTFGASFSLGPYMQEGAQATLPTGTDVNDFAQTTLGLDASYAHGKWQLWSELIAARFDVPRVGEVDVLSGFLEARYKLTPRLWIALRWNQAVFSDVPGLTTEWDRNGWRADLALGFRINGHAQLKMQYSAGDKQGNDREGDHLGAMQVTLRF